MKHRTKFWPLPILLGVLVAGGSLVPPQAESATDNGETIKGPICMQKVFGTPVTSSNQLNCTANDIRLSRAISVSQDTCTRGSKFNLTATFETIVTANSRYDAGFFFRIDGGANARGDGVNATGECSLSQLTVPTADNPNPPVLNLDGDTCGDLNSGTYYITFTIPDVLCQDSDGDGFLNLPNCTSWHSNQGTACAIQTSAGAKADTKSKCVCDDNFQVPVIVEAATITVVKDAAPSYVPESGGTVTYTVQVTNDASIESVTIDSIIDIPYGNLGTNTPPQTDNTCPSLVGTVLGPGGSTSCSFKALVSGDLSDTVKDVVEVCGTQSGNNNQVCNHDDATVNFTDVSTVPTLDKRVTSCTVDVTYQVVVSNNSQIDTLTVNSLTDDKFGDITVAHPAGGGFEQVVSTTCSLPQLAIAPSGNLTCSFVGKITNPVCDFTHTDTVTGNVTDDDSQTYAPSDSATVKVTATP